MFRKKPQHHHVALTITCALKFPLCLLKKLEKTIHTNKNKSPCSLSLDPGHNTDGSSTNGGKRIHKPSPGTRGIVNSKQPRWDLPPRRKIHSLFKCQVFRVQEVIKVFKLSTSHTLLRSRKYKNHLSSSGEKVYLRIANCPNKVNLFCSLLKRPGIEELKLPTGTAKCRTFAQT